MKYSRGLHINSSASIIDNIQFDIDIMALSLDYVAGLRFNKK